VIAGFYLRVSIFGGSSEKSQTNTRIQYSRSTTQPENTLSQMWNLLHAPTDNADGNQVIVYFVVWKLIPGETSADGLLLNELKMTKNAMALSQRSNSKGLAMLLLIVKMIYPYPEKIKMNEEANAIQAVILWQDRTSHCRLCWTRS